MADEKTTNLEPIEDGDLSLANKFGHVEKGDIGSAKESKEQEIPFSEKEVAQEVSAAEKDSSYNKILSKIKKTGSSAGHDADVVSDAEKVSLREDAEGQIQHLVDLAMNKDVAHAVKVAKHLEDNYILDMFHDKLLSEELHDALMKKGLIQ